MAFMTEKAEEWRVPIWVAAVNYRKAFDSIEHKSIWSALRRQHVPELYVKLLENLYGGQTAKVCTDRLSKEFSLSRGTKQGDPLSSLLFNAVLEDIIREVVQ